MEKEQKLNKQIKFGKENKKMKNLTNQDFKDIENEVKRDLIFKDKKHIKKWRNYYKNVVTKIFQLLKNVSLFK